MTDDDEFAFEYPARVRRVVDGDTFDLYLDLGLRQYGTYRVRLAEVDTAETYGRYASDEGETQAAWVRAWFGDGSANYVGEFPFVVNTYRGQGSFGRWLVDVRRRYDDADLAESLRDEFESLSE